MSGYNDKLHVLLLDVLERAKKLQVKQERLEVVREEVSRSLVTIGSCERGLT